LDAAEFYNNLGKKDANSSSYAYDNALTNSLGSPAYNTSTPSDSPYPSAPAPETPKWPTESTRVTSKFNRAHPLGIDIGAVKKGVAGDPVKASVGGRVTYAGDPDWSPSGSSYVIIDGNDSREHRYVHMDSLEVKTDDVVIQGTELGKMSNIGAPGGVHLHYEIRVGGEPVNPLSVLK
jgi:murein DD-endopeptidase MepM/ murein hydrolase activator NlpD